MFPGRLKTLTHDYKRNGTTTLFAAIEVADGKSSQSACHSTGIKSASINLTELEMGT